MDCPNCRAAAPQGAAECPACAVVFAKWRPPSERPAPPPPPPPAEPLDLPPPAAWSLAALPAVVCAWRFKDTLPLPQGWADLEKWWFPLSALNLVFHEAGHAIFGILGIPFLTTAGGTFMQLALPAACLVQFLKQKSKPGVGFCLFWVGINLINVAYYAADAQQQVIILITGLSGSEGGGHDWGYMLDVFGLKAWSVGIGRLVHLAGVACMAVGPAWGALEGARRFQFASKGN